MYVAGTNETYLSHTQIGGEKLKKADANVLGGVLNKYEVTQPNYAY